METTKQITVEVAYALPSEQVILSLDVPSDTNVEEVIKRSGILDTYPQIDLKTDKVGIFGKMCKLNAGLRHKDRIEIYRKLIADPKESRRQKAEMERKKELKQKSDSKKG
jgi:putative ubiquitin-RnfH superfamily antitoxin RatB of RatAB toxin-antitoxin module